VNARIRTLIVDDEPLAREGLKHLLQQDPDIEVIGECGDGVQAIEDILRTMPDLVLLDIQMPEANGFQVVEQVGADRMPLVVFVTAYDEYAVRAFRVHAFDYLLKPVDSGTFSAVLRTAKSHLAERKTTTLAEKLAGMLADLRGHTYLDRIMVKYGGKITLVNTREIDWIAAEGDYVEIHTSGKKYLVREKIGDLERRLDPTLFLRIHRSTIVALSRIRELQPLFSGEYAVILHDGQRLNLSRTHRDRVFSALGRGPSGAA
jgi:two-component system LytT family response regulator